MSQVDLAITPMRQEMRSGLAEASLLLSSLARQTRNLLQSSSTGTGIAGDAMKIIHDLSLLSYNSSSCNNIFALLNTNSSRTTLW